MQHTETKPNRVVRWALPVLLTLGVACFVASLVLSPPTGRRDESRPSDPLPVREVPDFTFTERSEKPVSKADLLGKVWVASFVFTKCTGPCPSVTGTFARLQSELDLASTPDLRLVSFTVDPGRDTPAELRKYADHFRAHPDRWLFLTGPEADVHKFAKDGFMLGVSRSQLPQPPAGQEFDHSTYLVVVDKQGRLRGHFDGYRGEHDPDGRQFEDSLGRLKQTVAALLKE